MATSNTQLDLYYEKLKPNQPLNAPSTYWTMAHPSPGQLQKQQQNTGKPTWREGLICSPLLESSSQPYTVQGHLPAYVYCFQALNKWCLISSVNIFPTGSHLESSSSSSASPSPFSSHIEIDLDRHRIGVRGLFDNTIYNLAVLSLPLAGSYLALRQATRSTLISNALGAASPRALVFISAVTFAPLLYGALMGIPQSRSLRHRSDDTGNKNQASLPNHPSRVEASKGAV